MNDRKPASLCVEDGSTVWDNSILRTHYRFNLTTTCDQNSILVDVRKEVTRFHGQKRCISNDEIICIRHSVFIAAPNRGRSVLLEALDIGCILNEDLLILRKVLGARDIECQNILLGS